MKIASLISVALLTLAISMPADAGFGGSRGGFSSGSRSSSSRSSSFGGSRSAPSAPSRSYSAPSGKSSSFGGFRSSPSPAPIVRRPTPIPSPSYSGGTVNHYYGGGSYGGGSGFWHGMALGYLWNRPSTVYIGGQNVVVDSNGQPQYNSDGTPVIYENSHPFLTFLGTLVMLCLFGWLVYFLYSIFKKESY